MYLRAAFSRALEGLASGAIKLEKLDRPEAWGDEPPQKQLTRHPLCESLKLSFPPTKIIKKNPFWIRRSASLTTMNPIRHSKASRDSTTTHKIESCSTCRIRRRLHDNKDIKPYLSPTPSVKGRLCCRTNSQAYTSFNVQRGERVCRLPEIIWSKRSFQALWEVWKVLESRCNVRPGTGAGNRACKGAVG